MFFLRAGKARSSRAVIVKLAHSLDAGRESPLMRRNQSAATSIEHWTGVPAKFRTRFYLHRRGRSICHRRTRFRRPMGSSKHQRIAYLVSGRKCSVPKDRGEGGSRFQRAERELKRVSDAFIRARAPVLPEPLVFSPSFQKEGMREAPPRANEPIVRSAKAQEHAPPTRLLPLRRSPSSQSADQTNGACG